MNEPAIINLHIYILIRFIVPTVSIHWGATMVHGMKVKNGRLLRRGQDLDADEDAAKVLGDFFR